MGALMTIVEHLKNAHHTPQQKIQIFSKLTFYINKFQEYNEYMQFSFWSLVRQDNSYVLKRCITIYDDMIEWIVYERGTK